MQSCLRTVLLLVLLVVSSATQRIPGIGSRLRSRLSSWRRRAPAVPAPQPDRQAPLQMYLGEDVSRLPLTMFESHICCLLVHRNGAPFFHDISIAAPIGIRIDRNSPPVAFNGCDCKSIEEMLEKLYAESNDFELVYANVFHAHVDALTDSLPIYRRTQRVQDKSERLTQEIRAIPIPWTSRKQFVQGLVALNTASNSQFDLRAHEAIQCFDGPYSSEARALDTDATIATSYYLQKSGTVYIPAVVNDLFRLCVVEQQILNTPPYATTPFQRDTITHLKYLFDIKAFVSTPNLAPLALDPHLVLVSPLAARYKGSITEFNGWSYRRIDGFMNKLEDTVELEVVPVLNAAVGNLPVHVIRINEIMRVGGEPIWNLFFFGPAVMGWKRATEALNAMRRLQYVPITNPIELQSLISIHKELPFADMHEAVSMSQNACLAIRKRRRRSIYNAFKVGNRAYLLDTTMLEKRHHRPCARDGLYTINEDES